jgi:hypothetical protein
MNSISRRKFFGYDMGAAAVAGISPLGLTKSVVAQSVPSAGPADAKTYLNSIKQAIAFLNQMMDAHASGSTVRLIQSYSDQSGLESTAFTYNNAMSIHALMR